MHNRARVSLHNMIPERPSISSSALNRWQSIHSDLIRSLTIVVPLLVLMVLQGSFVIKHAVLSLFVVLMWHFWFSTQQAKTPRLDVITTILLFTFALPANIAWWQAVLSISFGVVVGEQIFGGRGYSFLHPVVAGLAFLFYSFAPETVELNHPVLSGAVLLGLMILLYYRLVDWRVIIGIALGIASIIFATTGYVENQTIYTALTDFLPGSMVLAILFFTACDPAMGTVSRQGRWGYGYLIGIILTLSDPNLVALDAVVYACLLGSIAAPLIDWIVIQSYMRLTRYRHAE